MFAEWLQLQLFVLPMLAIPLAILLGMRRANGAIIVSATGALLVIAFRWYTSATSLTAYPDAESSLLNTLMGQAGGVLLLAAWTLSLAHTVQARRWRWFALLIVAGYLSFSVDLLAQLMQTGACSYDLSNDSFQPVCSQPNQALIAIIALGRAIGPIVMLLYALRASGRPREHLPEGLVISSLRDGPVVEENTIPAD